MDNHGQLYSFFDKEKQVWTPWDFEASAQRAIDYFQRQLLPLNDSSDPRVKGK